MDLITTLHRHDDGSPIEFAKECVALVEAHQSGAGTNLILAIGDSNRELHLREEVDDVRKELHMSRMERAMRSFATDGEQAHEKVPF